MDEKPIIEIGTSDEQPEKADPPMSFEESDNSSGSQDSGLDGFDEEVIDITLEDSKPGESEEAELVEAVPLEPEAAEAEVVEAAPMPPERPMRKRKKFNKKRLIPVGIIVLALLGAIFLPHFVIPSKITDVSIKVYDNPDSETVTLLLTVETSQFSRPYSGPVTVEVENGVTTKNLNFDVVKGDARETLDYEDFYVDNGDYTFTISVRDFSDELDFSLEKTCHYIDFQNAQVIMGAEEVRVAFDLLSSASGHTLATKGINGNGTIVIFNSTAKTEELYRDYFTVTGLHYQRTNRAWETYRGTYNFTIDFSTWAWKNTTTDEYVLNDYTATVYFYSDLPDTTPKVRTSSDKGFTIDPMAP